MTQWLRQTTIGTIVMGPYVGTADGYTAGTAYSITQADIRLSKNGAAFAQSANSAGAAHMENGYYAVPLGTADTDTLGRLRVATVEGSALPVWRDFMVVPQQVWDSYFASDRLQVDVREYGDSSLALTTQMKADVNAEADTALADVGVTTTVTGRVDAAITSRLASASYSAPPSAASIRSEVDANSTQLAAIKTKTDNLPTDPADDSDIDTQLATIAGYLDTEVAAIKTVTDALTSAAAAKLALSAGTMVTGNAITGTLSTTAFTTDLTEATDDHYNGRIVIFTSGVLSGQATDITDYDGATKTITVTDMTEAPSNGDDFIIV